LARAVPEAEQQLPPTGEESKKFNLPNFRHSAELQQFVISFFV
jgi:hypothetical protein